MKSKRIIKSGFLVMRRHKMRTFFMMVGIMIGITALTLILSLGKGTEKKVMDNIERMFTASSILISAGAGQMMGGPMSGGPTTTFTIEDLEVLHSEISDIDTWDPMQMIPAREVKYQENSDNIRVFGHSERAQRVWNIGVTRGEFFDGDAVTTSARVALIGTTAADTLFGDIDPIGEQIRIGTVPFRVIGILKQRGIDPHGWDRDNEILVPYTTAMRRLMNIDYVQTAKLLVKDPRKIERTAERITTILRERHSLAESEPDDFSILTPVQVQEMVSSANRIFNLFLPLIAGISLIVGGVIVANLMLISVNERTSEIGLRKAVGARSKDIQLQFLAETTVITLLGGIIGIVLGLVGSQAVSAMMKLPPSLSWEALALGVIFSTLVGLIAGVFPARRAASLQPVETLR
jgi:putative ABC transport system permease protein